MSAHHDTLCALAADLAQQIEHLTHLDRMLVATTLVSMIAQCGDDAQRHRSLIGAVTAIMAGTLHVRIDPC